MPPNSKVDNRDNVKKKMKPASSRTTRRKFITSGEPTSIRLLDQRTKCSPGPSPIVRLPQIRFSIGASARLHCPLNPSERQIYQYCEQRGRDRATQDQGGIIQI